MAQVELFKKTGTYTDKEGKEKTYTNFYVRCGDTNIPVQVSYFEGEDGRDPQYNARRAVMSAFAELLPDKPKTSEESKKKLNSQGKSLQSFDDDGDIPF